MITRNHFPKLENNATTRRRFKKELTRVMDERLQLKEQYSLLRDQGVIPKMDYFESE